MHRFAIKRTTKKRSALSHKTHVTAFVRPPVGTVPFGACADTCADTAECRLQCMCRGVRTANLHAVRSAITATAELLVPFIISDAKKGMGFAHYTKMALTVVGLPSKFVGLVERIEDNWLESKNQCD